MRMLTLAIVLSLCSVAYCADDVQGLKDRIAELEKENANLKKQIQYLMNKSKPKPVKPAKKVVDDGKCFTHPFKAGNVGHIEKAHVLEVLPDGTARCQIQVDDERGIVNGKATRYVQQNCKVVLSGLKFVDKGEMKIGKSFTAIKEISVGKDGSRATKDYWLLECNEPETKPAE
jgi:hypothetical protein